MLPVAANENSVDNLRNLITRPATRSCHPHNRSLTSFHHALLIRGVAYESLTVSEKSDVTRSGHENLVGEPGEGEETVPDFKVLDASRFQYVHYVGPTN